VLLDVLVSGQASKVEAGKVEDGLSIIVHKLRTLGPCITGTFARSAFCSAVMGVTSGSGCHSSTSSSISYRNRSL